MIRNAFLLAALLAAAGPAAAQTYFTDIGYTQLLERLGGAVPTGAGVPVLQVEAPAGDGQYDVDPAVAAGRAGFNLFNRSGTTAAPFSGHATEVARFFYGNIDLAAGTGSMAYGVTAVDLYEANDWIGIGFLRAGTPLLPPTTGIPKVSNHSYIGPASDDILRRADYLVDQGNHVMVVAVGLNGSAQTPNPGVAGLFGSAYNPIVVGRSDGLNGRGLTTANGVGRVKPDIVAPNTLGVSFATPIVSAAATLLVQTAGQLPAFQTEAARPQTIKAVLLAGATKDEPEFAAMGGWSRTPTRPLDPNFGAGEVNINASHRILSAGRQPASTTATVPVVGWDFNSVSGGSARRTYFFDVPAGQTTGTLSAVLAWHREFPGRDLTPSLANLDLSLRTATGFTVSGGPPLDQSVSTVDNVEHVYSTAGLSAGRYALVVDLQDAGASSYALAWEATLVPVPEPGLVLAAAAVAGLVGRRVRRQRLAAR